MHYNLFAFYDGYKDLVYLKIVLNEGRVSIGADYPELREAIDPGFSPDYPLFVFLTSSFSLITNLEPLKTAVIFPAVTGFFAFLLTLLLVKELDRLKQLIRLAKYGKG